MTIDYGTLVRTRRQELGMSQSKLAELANCHRSTVIALELNHKAITFDIFLDILAALDLKMDIQEVNS